MANENGGFIQTPQDRIYGQASPEEIEVMALVDSVDLDYGFSPVLELPLPEGYISSFHVPCPTEVRQTGSGYLLIGDPRKPAQTAEPISAYELKLMRARYLKVKGDLSRNFRRLGHTAKGEAIALYFDGHFLEVSWR